MEETSDFWHLAGGVPGKGGDCWWHLGPTGGGRVLDGTPGSPRVARGHRCFWGYLPCPSLACGSAESFPPLGELANRGQVTLCPAPILQNCCVRGRGMPRPGGGCDPQADSAQKRGPDPSVAPWGSLGRSEVSQLQPLILHTSCVNLCTLSYFDHIEVGGRRVFPRTPTQSSTHWLSRWYTGCGDSAPAEGDLGWSTFSAAPSFPAPRGGDAVLSWQLCSCGSFPPITGLSAVFSPAFQGRWGLLHPHSLSPLGRAWFCLVSIWDTPVKGTLSIVTSREIAGYKEVEDAGGGMAGKAGLSWEMVGSALSELTSLPTSINRYWKIAVIIGVWLCSVYKGRVQTVSG